ncbi:MAG: TrmH family RNA methyltransferase [Aestuariivirga sp.]
MIPVTSLQNPIVKLVRSLEEKKGRREHGLFAAEGIAMLERALACGWTPEHVLATKPVALWDDVKQTTVSKEVMSALSAQKNPHDVMATFKMRYERGVTPEGTWLALEEIRDPGNLGTILRTADAANISGIVLAGECCDPYSRESVRASTGSVFRSRIAHMPSAKLADLCKGWPGDCVGAAAKGGVDYRWNYAQPTLIVLGSEARGLSEAVAKACKKLVRIPMVEGVESLNVATSAALLMYEVQRPRLS